MLKEAFERDPVLVRDAVEVLPAGVQILDQHLVRTGGIAAQQVDLGCHAKAAAAVDHRGIAGAALVLVGGQQPGESCPSVGCVRHQRFRLRWAGLSGFEFGLVRRCVDGIPPPGGGGGRLDLVQCPAELLDLTMPASVKHSTASQQEP
ncbi:hypothetical protein [Streptomyces sp. UG1]|uniref:hypothetical protein n=1 Tax=Streptomyces sp. UG1 TaxID=3417652 RepID=UPI003CF3924F